jgi:dipeptidyl aminopeptidase/acylaminoacyl peptidase
MAAAAPRRPMEPRDLARIRFVSDPQLSPDGRRIAFVVTTLSEEDDEYHANIWLVDAGGGEPRRLTTGAKRDSAPRWSPDGARLAFLSEREGVKGTQLYVLPVEGGEALRLTTIKRGVSSPVWSPDGTRLAFLSRVGGWEEPESEEEKRKSKPARVITTMRYQSNGEGFISDRWPHLFVVAADGGEPRQLTDGDFADSDPAWSPDGGALAFVSARHEDRDYDNASDVFLVSAEGGEPRRLTDTAGPVSSPAFSPDGRLIAYVGSRQKNEAGRNMRLFTVPTAGGASTCLTPDLDRSIAPLPIPLWSGGGRLLYVGAAERGNVPVYRAAADGRGDVRAVVGGERQVAALSLAGGRLAFAASDPVHPAELFVCDPDGGGERQVTDLNRAWLEEVALAAPERLRYEREGVELDCWVMRPFGYEEGKRYPALLSIHGGPHAQYGNTFFDEFQVYAGAGYVVVYTNPRGSQGYGEAFTRAVIGRWGDVDFADLMAGLDAALRAHPAIDPERLGVLGGSYGGYLASWTVGHTQRFKAACSERALNTFVSFFGTSDIGPWFAANESGSLPWEDFAWYVEHSPLTYAPAITTPLLIMHSENDLRCPIEQGEQFCMALKRLRREVRFIRFPDESHELSRSGKPRHRLERFRYLLEWFAGYLQPEAAGAREDARQPAASVQ